MPRNTSRDENIRAMYEAGMTLEQIGVRYGVTRERIRQILRKIGVPSTAGGISKRAARKRAARAEALDLRYIRRFGVDFATLTTLRANGATVAWREQRRNAKNRGIKWDLTLGQWWQLWQESGKWEQRGRGKGRYCLARYADQGDYTLGNVWVCEFSENCREARMNSKSPRGDNVHFLFPGTARPWVAKQGNTYIGFFATREEAVEAKRRYLVENPHAIRSGGGKGRGWTIRKRCKSRPYQVLMRSEGRTLFAYFSTQQAAEDAYRTFWLEQRGLLVRADPFFRLAA